ncbi:MAG: alkaline phosphatase PhoX [Candidatus Latescibacterota bacterium]|jgi:secreted PhoX family phosphatase
MQVSRRRFLKAAAVSVAFSGLQRHIAWADTPGKKGGYGPLVPDSHRILDLPEGFSYRVISRTGDPMADGLLLPGAPDAMATFAGPDGRTLLVRNHELTAGSKAAGPFGAQNELMDTLPKEDFYDWGHGKDPSLGGTTTVVIAADGQVEKQFLSLAGTIRNCAGGPTPWGSWVTCEETMQLKDEFHEKNHGYNFEVPARAEIGRARPEPLRDMGRFNHEAIAVDPKSGIVYQTEDRDDSLIYRYIPNEKGHLAAGGRLQALVVIDAPSLDTRNWEETLVRPGEPMAVRWIDMERVRSPKDDLRLRGFAQGAARFARGEGMWYGQEAIYFACTSGGSARKGQIWRYMPSPQEGTEREEKMPGYVELFVEPNDGAIVDNADNLTVSPWGDLVVCEDGPEQQFLVGVTPAGQLYQLARNALNKSEFAGAVFAPDGETLYVNIQNPGVTLAIQGPWQQG